MKVDLFTLDKDLEALMIEEYPGKIKGDQHGRDSSDHYGMMLYCFYNLEGEELVEFLDKNYRNGLYEIRDINGTLVRVVDRDQIFICE
jgi:hypothetical protein